MLQLIISRSGFGKTEYVFSSIKKLCEKNEKNMLLITPEQFSFIAEKRLLSLLGESMVRNVESTSFTGLVSNVFKKHGGNDLPVLSKGAKAVKMKEAIEMVQNSLTLFDRKKLSVSFIDSVIRIYDELKSCRVTCEDIIAVSENTEKELLSRKLHDIELIISAYDALIENEYYDPANELTRLYEKLLVLDYFKDRTVYIDGFSGFAAQEYKIIEVILRQAKALYITFCTDSESSPDGYDLFSYVNRNIRILYDETKKAGVKILNPIELKTPYRFKNEELKTAEDRTFAIKKEEYGNKPENISLYCAKNISDECDRTAFEISRLLRNGYKAREITVICRDMDKYERELGYSFAKYNIPYFQDERQSISSQPLVMLVNFLLRAVIYSYRSEDIFSLLKTGLTELDGYSVNELENYVFLWNISGVEWKEEFTKSTEGFVEEMKDYDIARLKSVNDSRKYITDVLKKFQAQTKNATVEEICRAIYNAVKFVSADKKLRELARALENEGKSALSREQGRIWDMLMDILEKLVTVAGAKTVSLPEFYKLFTLMLSNEDLGSIPLGLDNVQLGSADRIRCDNPRAVFIVGANEGEFPKSNVSSGIFTESERIELQENDFKLYSYGEILNAQERYFAYMALSAASEKLYVSYLNAGDGVAESSIVTSLRKVFPKLVTGFASSEFTAERLESRDNAFEILASSYNENNTFISSLKEYFKGEEEYASRLEAVRLINTNSELGLSKSFATELFGKNLSLSATKVEEYYKCPFRYFCNYGLRAKPRKRAKLDPMSTGTVVHYVLENVLKEKGTQRLRTLSDSEIGELVNKYLSEYLNTKMGDAEKFTPRFKYQFMRLSKMLVFVVIRLRDEFIHSDFDAKAFELKIGNDADAEVKSRTLNLPDGGTVEIHGKVDRLDIYEENGEKFIRVVDYKSKNKSFKLSDVMYGLNLQMLIYLFTVSESESEYAGISSGVLYMHSTRDVFAFPRNPSEDELSEKERKELKMKGIVLNDDGYNIAGHMERELKGEYIPVTYNSDKDKYSGNLITLEQLGMVAEKIDRLIVEMADSLQNGKITQYPVNGKDYDDTCDYCDYSDICKNRKSIECREIKSLKNNEVFKLLKEEQDDDEKVD
ncbi:MAG: PD-(D/E)XK nuclease family protein [Eubacterium sp.]|nr:PD-(D/E)XK nuclease family protein [Eubacterium sp.]